MPSKTRTRTMFGEAKDPLLASIVSFTSPESAKASATKLKSLFDNAPSCARKLHIYRAVIQATNRARASTKRRTRPLSAAEKSEYLGVADVYAKLQAYMKKNYAECKAERVAAYRRKSCP